MSLSRCKTDLKRACNSLVRSKQKALDRHSEDSSYLPQVTKKVQRLEKQCGNIEIDSPSSQHRPILGQEVRPPDQHSTESTVDSTSVNSRSLSGFDEDVQESVPRVPEGGGAVASTPLTKIPSLDTISVASARLTSKDVAQHLISKEQMGDYFSALVENPASKAIEENLSEERCDFTTTYEENMAQARGEDRFTKLYDLPLKLILTPIRVRGAVVSKFASLLEMQFGPLHAALQVGDVILEWNDSSLVIPHYVEHDDQLMRTDVRHLTDWVSFTSEEEPRVCEAIRTLDFPQQRELIYRVTAEKRRLLDNLVDVIVTYNRQFYYDIIRRNCQHFVADALKALGVNEPIDFTGGLGDYFRALKKGKSQALNSSFTSHAHLDEYVKEKVESREISSFTKDDLEYLLAQYFRYHLEQKSQLQGESGEAELSGWSCEIKGCFMERLERRIDFESLRIHNFKTYDKPQ